MVCFSSLAMPLRDKHIIPGYRAKNCHSCIFHLVQYAKFWRVETLNNRLFTLREKWICHYTKPVMKPPHMLHALLTRSRDMWFAQSVKPNWNSGLTNTCC